MTANSILNQHVSRRRKASPLHTINYQSKCQPAVFSGGFMDQFKQKPAHTRRQRGHSGSFHLPRFSFFQFDKSDTSKPRSAASNGKVRRRGRSGFSFPVPSLATVVIVAGTLLVSLAALNWEGLNVSRPEAYALRPGADGEGMRNLASYAGFEVNAPVISRIPVEITPAAAVSAAPEAEHSLPESEEIPLDLMETFKWFEYKVQKGDSVSKIAARFGVSMDAVISSNAISNARRLREGETLRIPNIDGIPYTVKKGDSLSKIAKIYEVPLEIILDVNDVRSDTIREGETLFIPGARMAPEALRLAMGDLFIYPVQKRITSLYDWRADPFTGVQRFHAALDLAGSIGTPVKAAMDGTVSAVSVNRIYGNFIILNHAGGYQTLYAHLSASSVKQGERVTQGGKIGEVGNTGQSTGPHLHFAVFKNGKAVNPLDLLQ